MARYHVHIGRANGTRETLHCLTAPDGGTGLVQLTQGGRNVTLHQFRSSVASHGVTRACAVFWRLRARDAQEAENRARHGVTLAHDPNRPWFG